MVNKKSSSSKMMEEDSTPETEVSKDFINFFLDGIKEIYWGGKYTAKALPKIRKAVTDSALKDAISHYTAIERLQSERLEQIFELLEETPKTKKCDPVAALLEEANAVIQDTKKGSGIRDTGIVAATQKVAHYGILTYGTLLQLARTMGNEDIISLLDEALSSAKEVGDNLAAISEGPVSDTPGSETFTKGDERVIAIYDSKNLTKKNTVN